ncbi:MAG: NAD(P)-binding domain-containing protein [Deltaproteobacteria bacterium]|nr:NAD(P)-binding domain-containing protein [Deltaproteobacteria bacterium]
MALTDILKISFEFSSKVGTRELPHLGRDYQSNVRGLYIVGDLADAPVIKIALNQGYDVTRRLIERELRGQAASAPAGDVLDLLIIGAGPAGIGAALAAKEHNLRYRVVERERPFNTIQNYPKNKHVFSEPRDFGANRFPFMDSLKEDLVQVWERALDDHALVIDQPFEVIAVEKKGELFEARLEAREGAEIDGQPVKPGTSQTLRARRVVLAIGRRGSVNKIGCPGEDLDKVAYGLNDPEKHRGERCLVVGGGDSAVEAAIALARAGAEVTIAYRGESFIRAKAANKEAIERLAAEKKLRAAYHASVGAISPTEVVLRTPAGEERIANDRVFVLIGTKLPLPFLQKLGVRMEGALTLQRVAFIVSFALATYLFYCIKAHQSLWPVGPGHPLASVHDALKVNLGWRWVDGGFWGTVIYSTLITVFGIQAIRKYRSPVQARRYLSLIGFQLVFLFGIPELIAPLLIEKPWKVYALTVPWPLSIWSLIHTETLWLILGALTAFVAMPLFVRYHGERFCSWACGCGGLAETLGDRWRHLAPRGTGAKKAELFGRVVFVLAAATTAVILGHDVFGFLTGPTWTNTKVFVQQWYGLMVDFWFAAVVGVAFYPYLGNRVWCRFLCPLRAYMEVLSKWFGRLKIVSNEKCIGCGECTRYCQMGIPVQRFAQMRQDLANHNSACIQCGICVEVCPMKVLSLTRDGGRGIDPIAGGGDRASVGLGAAVGPHRPPGDQG